MEASLLIAAIVFLTFWSAFFSGSEIALFSLPSLKIKTFQSSSDARKRLIAKLVLRSRDLLVTIYIMNTLVNILLQNASSSFFGDEGGWGLKVGVPLIITLVLGEVLPKYIALQTNVGFSYRVSPAVNFFHNGLHLVRKAFIAITVPVSRLMFFFLRKEETLSKDELQHVLRTSHDYGVLPKDEADLIFGCLNLIDAQIKELMRPREDILFFDINAPLSTLTHFFIDQACTRLPICEKNLDNILGVMTANQFFLYRDRLHTSSDLYSFLLKPFFIPETTSARLLMRRLDEKNEEMAIVVDEYGSISGLITYQDLIETVIGKMSDKRDLTSHYTRASRNVIIASGKLELAELQKLFEIPFTSLNNMVTIGGWLTEQLGDIPKSGTKHETPDFLFQVLAADPNRIRRLYIRKLTSSESKRG